MDEPARRLQLGTDPVKGRFSLEEAQEMAGTIVINDHADWLPAGWVYDNALEAVANELRRHDTALADHCLAARISVSQGFLDLNRLDADGYRRFLSAAEQALATVQSTQSGDLTRCDYYSGYLDQFERLCELLRADPRAAIDGVVSAGRHARGT